MKRAGDSSLWALAEAAEKEVSTWPDWKRRAADTALVTRPPNTRKIPGERLYYREYPGGAEGIEWEDLSAFVRRHFVLKAKNDHTLVEPPELGGPLEIVDVPPEHDDKTCLRQAMTHLSKALGWLSRTGDETRTLRMAFGDTFGEIRKLDLKSKAESSEKWAPCWHCESLTDHREALGKWWCVKCGSECKPPREIDIP